MKLVLPALGEERVSSSEIQAVFTAFATHINAPNLQNDHLEQTAVNFRQFSQAPVRVLHYKSRNPGISGPFAGWYLINATRLVAPATMSDVLNQDGENSPVMMFEGRLYFSDWTNTNPAGRFRIGYSQDNGVTWTTIAGTERPVGLGSAESQRFFDAGQLHYYTRAPGYLPFNQPSDGKVLLLAAFGGPFSMADPSLITDYGVLVNTNNLGVGLQDTAAKLRMREPTG